MEPGSLPSGSVAVKRLRVARSRVAESTKIRLSFEIALCKAPAFSAGAPVSEATANAQGVTRFLLFDDSVQTTASDLGVCYSWRMISMDLPFRRSPGLTRAASEGEL